MTIEQIIILAQSKKRLILQARAMIDATEQRKEPLHGTEKDAYDKIMLEVVDINNQIGTYNDNRNLKEISEANEAEHALDLEGQKPVPTLVGPRGSLDNQRAVTSNSKFLTRSQNVSRSQAFLDSRNDDEPLDVGRAIRGAVTGNWLNAEAERRAMVAGQGSSGGFLLTPAMSGQLIDLARNQSVCVQAGAQTILMDSGEEVVAKVTKDPTAYWLGEGAAIPPTDVTFGKVTLRATILAALCTLSISLAADASNIDALIKTSLSAAIGSEMDRAGLFGSGVAEPLGLYATPEINTYSLGANGKVLADYDFASYASQYVANANGIATAVVMSPRSSFALDRLKDTLLQPLTPPASFTALTPFVSNQVANALTWGSAVTASAMLVGDFTGLAFGIAPSEGGQYGIRLDVARESAFNTLQVQIRAYLRCDVAVLRPTWFTRVCGVL